MTDRCEKVAGQIRQRVSGEKIADRVISLHDPDARPIRKGKLGKPTEFGYVSQLVEVTENTKPGARGLILPASSTIGNPQEVVLLPATVAELARLGIRPKEVGSTRAFNQARRTARSRTFSPRPSSWPGDNNPPASAPPAGCGATAPERKDGSATSNDATGWTDPA
jgi:transposase, IS5 family